MHRQYTEEREEVKICREEHREYRGEVREYSKEETFTGITCKVVTSVGGSVENHSVESKVEEIYHFGESTPFDNQPKKMQRLEEELNDIDKLKIMYQSRNDKNDRSRNYNTQTSEKSKSIEKKHLLKPSQTPCFTRRFETGLKIQKKQEEVKENQDRTKLFYMQAQMNSGGKGQHNSGRKGDNLQPDQFHEIAALTEELIRLKRQMQERDSERDEEVSQLNATISALNRQKGEAMQSTEETREDNRIMKLEIQRMSMEKEQLETILKDLLYEREKERLFQGKEAHSFHSKETPKAQPMPSHVSSSRKSLTPGKCVIRPSPRDQNLNSNYAFQRIISGTKPPLKEAKEQPVSANEQQESKKVKVQSILDKLKIKINKT